jgi:hypothetical protein
MAESTIHRYEIPVDDHWHILTLTGDVIHVAARRPEVVELWAVAGQDPPDKHRYRVFGTGQPLPQRVETTAGDGPLLHVGTALAAGGQLVWHLFEQLGDWDG